MSVSQAQGRIVRPMANMEIAEDHLEKIQHTLKMRVLTSGPTTQDPQLKEGLQETPVQLTPDKSSSSKPKPPHTESTKSSSSQLGVHF